MKKTLFFIIPLIIITIIAILLNVSLCGQSIEYCIFENISECNDIKMSTLPGSKFESYSPKETDKNIKDLLFEESFCGKFSCDDFEFVIFAYEFADSESAKQYYINNTGKINDPSTSFSESWGVTFGEIIVIDLERVYRIEAKTKYREEVCSFLNEIFSKEIEI